MINTHFNIVKEEFSLSLSLPLSVVIVAFASSQSVCNFSITSAVSCRTIFTLTTRRGPGQTHSESQSSCPVCTQRYGLHYRSNINEALYGSILLQSYTNKIAVVLTFF